MADSRKKIEIVVEGSDRASAPLRSVQSAITKLSQTLENAKKSAKQFNALFEIGLGVGVGTKMFDIIHRGLERSTSGFLDAIKAGRSFAEAIRDADRALFGLETRLQSQQRATEMWRKANQSVSALQAQAGSSFNKAIGMPERSPRFPYLANPSEAEQSLSQYRKAVADAREAAGPARDEFARARAGEMQLRGMQSGGMFSRFGGNLLQSMPEWTGLKMFNEPSADVQRRYRGVLGVLSNAEQELADKTAELEQQNEKARRAVATSRTLSSWISNGIANVRSGARQVGYGFDDRFGSVLDVFGRGLSEAGGYVTRGAAARLAGGTDETDRLGRFNQAIRGFQQANARGATGGVLTGTDSRYLSRGTGVMSPEVIELKAANKQRSEVIRTNKQIIRKLQDIERKMKPLAAANVG